MKTLLTFALALAGPLLSLNAQTNNSKAAEPGETKAAKKRSDIKDLMVDPAFTNASGMVMVKISPSMWAGKFLVTQEEYQKVAGSNPSQFNGSANPVDSVSWNDARSFCTKLNDAERKEDMLPEGYIYTLPTQAQWESLVAGAELKDAVTSLNNSRSSTAPVGSLGANSLGLYDIRGDLWEFCLDPEDQPYRVLRGGAWNTFYEPNSRVEFRWYADGPDDRKNSYGFRCVMVPGEK
jgi:formylglycine-generating enzyme required for sulfatase activity